MSGSLADRRKRLVSTSLLFIPLLPTMVVLALALHHAIGFRGVCGPYATDIPAHACGFGTYLANFFGGFSGIALTLIAGASALLACVIVALGWLVAALVHPFSRSAQGAKETSRT